MLQFLRSIWRRLFPRPQAPEPDPPALPLPEPESARPRRRAARGSGKAARAARLRDDILEQLDRYQVYIKRLKKYYPDQYRKYRRLGASMMPSDYQLLTAGERSLEPSVLADKPGFGAIGFCLAPIWEEIKTIGSDGLPAVNARFVFFDKLTKPGRAIERTSGGEVYKFIVYWDDVRDEKIKAWGYGGSQEYAVVVSDDGGVRALRMLRQEAQTIRHRDGQRSQIVHQRWGLPPIEREFQRGLPPAEIIRNLFVTAMNQWAQSNRLSMIRVTATKGEITMPFLVDVLDTPQFFADRITVTNAAGKTSRIFHVVRPHVRADGQKVKMHFRGLRRFRWHDYGVSITVPGRDHPDTAAFPVGTHIFDEGEEIPRDYIDAEEMGDMVANVIEGRSLTEGIAIDARRLH